MKNLSLDEFLRIEEKYDLYNAQKNGCFYWIYVRVSLWEDYVLKKRFLWDEKVTNSEKEFSRFANKIKEIALVIPALRNIQKMCHKKDIIFLSHPRRVKNGDEYECIYTDIIKSCFKNSISVEVPYMGRHMKPMMAESVFYTEHLDVLMRLYMNFYVRLRKKVCAQVLKEISEKISPALEELCEVYEIVLNKEEICSSVFSLWLSANIKHKLYRHILKKIQPKLLIEVVGYEREYMYVSEVAHELNIPVVELQHGIANSLHIAYQFGCGEKIPTLPDKILLFSDFWKKTIKMPNDSYELISVGYPYFEKNVKKYTKAHVAKRNIVIISQGTIGIKLSKLSVELYNTLKDKYHIIYKLHPDEYVSWKSDYPWLVDSGIEVIDTKERNLYGIFSECSVQVGVYSTAILEGLGFGLRTYLYQIESAEIMKPIVDEGYAKFFKDCKQLAEQIIEDTDKKTDMSLSACNFWKEHALENTINEINKILEKTS